MTGARSRDERLAGLTSHEADWAGLRVVVTGLGVSGFAAADALIQHGAHVRVVDAQTPVEGTPMGQRAQILEVLDAELHLGDGAETALPVPADEIDLVVTSPGWSPAAPLLAGFRGAAKADVAALAQLIADISVLAARHAKEIAEIELNPVLVHAEGKGVTIVDALVVGRK